MSLLHRIPERFRIIILTALNVLLFLVLAWQLGERFAHEASGAFNGDSPIYWAVGRGLVNGYRLYADLFDIKPPGIFLLSALSFALDGTMAAGHLVQALVLVLLPLTMLVPVFVITKHLSPERRLLALLLALGIGGALTLYTAHEGGEFQTESFGIFFAASYVACCAILREKPRLPLSILAGVFFFGGLLFKEPFALAAVASGLLLCRTRGDIVRMMLLPGLLGGALFALTLLSMGALDEYFTLYLPFMTGERTQRFGSPFSRAVLLEATWTNLWKFSPVFMLLLSVVWIRMLARATRTSGRSPADIGRFLLLLVSLVLLSYGVQTYRLFPWLTGKWVTDQSPFFLAVGSLLLLWTVRQLLRPYHDKMPMLLRILAALFALFVTGYMAGLSGEFVGHHFLFAVPIYMAMALLLLPEMVTAQRLYAPATLVILTLAILTVFFHATMDFSARRAGQSREAEADRTLAATVDGVLAACERDRYLIVGETGTNVFGYTAHSPIGPIFFQQTLIGTHLPFLLSFVQELKDSDIIVTAWNLDKTNLPGLREYLHSDFSRHPPSCAAGLVQPSPVNILFRIRNSDLELAANSKGVPYLRVREEGP